MATLPLYQQTGYLPADVPRLDLANLKEQANQLNTITSSLDRLSNFAFKKAAEQAEREGLQYGAENQPSLEQVMAAMNAANLLKNYLLNLAPYLAMPPVRYRPLSCVMS